MVGLDLERSLAEPATTIFASVIRPVCRDWRLCACLSLMLLLSVSSPLQGASLWDPNVPRRITLI